MPDSFLTITTRFAILRWRHLPQQQWKDMPACDARCATWKTQVSKGLANILETTNFVSPEGSYHESLDYMRITWAALTLLAEFQRTTTGVDPAQSLLHVSQHRQHLSLQIASRWHAFARRRQRISHPRSAGHGGHRICGESLQRSLRRMAACVTVDFSQRQWVIPVLEFLWDDPRSHAARSCACH